MKFYVVADMEGISGIVLQEQLFLGQPFYQEGRQLLTDEVNAVVESLIQAGAADIIVRDGHASGFNFLTHQLHPGARYVQGVSQPGNRFPGLDSSFDGALLIGYHSMGGTLQAVRDHSYSSRNFTGMSLNGTPIGEIGLDALHFGLHGVPVIFVSGDDKACHEAQRQLGSAVTYVTKTGAGQHTAILKAPALARREMGEAIQEAVKRMDQAKPYVIPGPYELVVHYTATHIADSRVTDGDSVQRVDGLSVKYRDADFFKLMARALH